MLMMSSWHVVARQAQDVEHPPELKQIDAIETPTESVKAPIEPRPHIET